MCPWNIVQKCLISGYTKAKRNCYKTFNKDMFIDLGERSLSWPTTGLVEA